MRVRCTCGQFGVLARPGKRKNCRKCGRDLRDAKPAKPREVSIKAKAKKAKAPDPLVDPDPKGDEDPTGDGDAEE